MNDIDNLRGYNPSGGGSNLFLKIADGEQVKVRLASLPVIFSNSFEDPRTGEVKVDTRFAFVIWNHDAAKAQIWVTNGATYGQQITVLLDDEDYGDWREYDVKIKRSGEKAQTRYNLTPGVKRYKLDTEARHACDAIDIIAKISAGKGAAQVMWLSEYREMEENAKSGSKQAAAPADEPDMVHEVLDGEPIDLDSIPF